MGKNRWWIVVAVLVLAGAGLAYFYEFSSIEFVEFSSGSFLGKMAGLLLVTLFVERFLEVLVAGIQDTEYQAEETAARVRLSTANEELRARRTMLELEKESLQRSSIEVQKSHRDQLESHHEQIEQEIEKAAEARGTLAKQRAKFRRLTLAFGLVLGLVAGILGVRAIELFVENPDDLPGLFRAFDVVVTAGLIAGGSDGIHQLVDTFVQYLERVRENQNT